MGSGNCLHAIWPEGRQRKNLTYPSGRRDLLNGGLNFWQIVTKLLTKAMEAGYSLGTSEARSEAGAIKTNGGLISMNVCCYNLLKSALSMYVRTPRGLELVVSTSMTRGEIHYGRKHDPSPVRALLMSKSHYCVPCAMHVDKRLCFWDVAN